LGKKEEYKNPENNAIPISRNYKALVYNSLSSAGLEPVTFGFGESKFPIQLLRRRRLKMWEKLRKP
jgi:hypothetical protein